MKNKKYTFWKLLDENSIEIPIIQRDYAQGRAEESRIRDKFLDDIHKKLKDDNIPPMNLDFVYGRIIEKKLIPPDDQQKLIPLDGQQRLTTLFLLHWYLAVKDDRLSDIKKLLKFTYETRVSSREFCKALVANNIDLIKDKISEEIEDKNWFFKSWKKDPTIKSMLNMLDAIHKKFKGESVGLFNKLTSNDCPPITFDFLLLDDFNLTDELYIKMNARGKLLTEFENFKAKFESYIVDDKVKAKSKFDNEWLDIFYKLAQQDKNVKPDEAPKLADEMFYNFFYNVTFNFYVEGHSFDKEFTSEKTLFDFYLNVYQNPNKVDEVLVILDNIDKSNSAFQMSLALDITYWDRARFFAYCLGLVCSFKPVEMDRWIRVTNNLINNTLIQSPDDFEKAIKSLRKLSENTNFDVYSYLRGDATQIDYFLKIQIEEEILKARLISEDTQWEKELIAAEKNWYLDGQIGFLLDYCDKTLQDFINYMDKFISLWDFAKENKDNQILLYQALLTKGDYLPSIGSNYTFCSFDTALRTKMDNWRKVFNDSSEESKKLILKKLLDDGNFIANNILESLQQIIDKYSDSDWKSYFIKNRENISYCENLQIRWQNEHEIYLLKKMQMNGAHAEFYTYDLYLQKFGLKPQNERKVWWRLESNKTFDPFPLSWYYISTSSDKPVIVLDEWEYKSSVYAMDIGYEENGFYIKLYSTDENNTSVEQDIVDTLKQKGFDDNNKKNSLSFNDILEELQAVCESLTQKAHGI